jgi:hypothetical protein
MEMETGPGLDLEQKRYVAIVPVDLGQAVWTAATSWLLPLLESLLSCLRRARLEEQPLLHSASAEDPRYQHQPPAEGWTAHIQYELSSAQRA